MAIRLLTPEQQEYCKLLISQGMMNKTRIAKELVKHFGLDTNIDSLRRTVERILHRMEEDEHRGNAINYYSEEQKTGVNNIRHAWHKVELEDGTKASVFVKNPQDEIDDRQQKEEMLQSVKEIIDSVNIKKLKLNVKPNKQKLLLKITISDAHVGLNPNPDGNGLFQYEYNADLYFAGLQKVLNSIQGAYLTYGTFDQVVLQDLGDALDGWNGFTTRGGHALDQNMTNIEAFKTYIRGKIDLIESILEAGITKKIIVRDICNDNHSGQYGAIANFTVGEIINKRYGEGVIEFQQISRFIEHFSYGQHCFILTHGKDTNQMKRALPLILNDKAIKFINEYIEHYSIDAQHIHIEKGDLHQLSYQKIKKFDYRNYMSFAPGSAWVAHNFGDTYSGYSIDIVPHDSGEIVHSDHFIDYRRK